MHTVERLHALVESNNDSLLLVLGSLAEFAPKEVSSCKSYCTPCHICEQLYTVVVQ